MKTWLGPYEFFFHNKDRDRLEGLVKELRSENARLRKTLKIATDALKTIHDDKWAFNQSMKNYDCTVGTLTTEALKRLGEKDDSQES